jgi:hypothetical protein
MRKLGVSKKMMRAVMSTLEGAECTLHVDGETRTVKMKNGAGQGTVLGPVLHNLFFLPLLLL